MTTGKRTTQGRYDRDRRRERLDLPIVGRRTAVVVGAMAVPHREWTANHLPNESKSWHRGSVTFWLALRRLLPLLAVIGLALTPVAAPAAAAGMRASATAQARTVRGTIAAADHADIAGSGMDGADMDDMPCCPPGKTAKPDCAKAGCPLLALCLAGIASLLPTAVSVPAPVAMRTIRAWPAAEAFASVHGTPSPEPPRA